MRKIGEASLTNLNLQKKVLYQTRHPSAESVARLLLAEAPIYLGS